MSAAVVRRGQSSLYRKRNLRAEIFRRQQGRPPLERFVDERIRVLPVKRPPVQQTKCRALGVPQVSAGVVLLTPYAFEWYHRFYILLVLCITTLHAPYFIYRHLLYGPTVMASIPTPVHQLTHSRNNSKSWTKRKKSRLARIGRTNTYRQHGRREYF